MADDGRLQEPNALDEKSEIKSAEEILRAAIKDDRPLVGIIGQSIGLPNSAGECLMTSALARLGLSGTSWKDLFSRGPIQPELYAWLNERFERRSPARDLIDIADTHFSAIYTSSFDPTIRNLFATDGREPEPVVVGDPPPPISRSKLNPRIYYLFGITGAGTYQPPKSVVELKTRRVRHAVPMLNTVLDVATPLGIILVDGFKAGEDWLDPGELIGQMSEAPRGSVIWFGADPGVRGEDDDIFRALVSEGIIVRDERRLASVLAEIRASDPTPNLQVWNEQGVISFIGGKKFITTPSIRLSTEASSSIVDDAWTDTLDPESESKRRNSFSIFHSIPSSPRLLFDGVRRGFAFTRDFEEELFALTERALRDHSKEKGAIVLCGQSGIGKSIALFRLASRVRENKTAAVLVARDRVPMAAELGSFLSEVDKLDQVTLLLIDAHASPKRYDSLLESFRSRGHRVVIVGTSYKLALPEQRHDGKLLEAPADLSDKEKGALQDLATKYGADSATKFQIERSQHALAQFFWSLPQSRSVLSSGLGKEARATERSLRERGRTRKPVEHVTALAFALLEAGYRAESPILQANDDVDEHDAAAAKIIDYVMACSRVHRWVPVNLLLRAVVSDSLNSQRGVGTELVRELFDGHDLFRWRYSDNTDDELLVGARLQLEAQLICDQRMGGALHEARRIIDLISSATRAGPEGSEETRFVAEIVFALGPDGPLGERYAEAYREIAEELTCLRRNRGVKNARLMLQEATLRRHFIRRNDRHLRPEETELLLDDARDAVEEALSELQSPQGGMRAGRRTIENLWVERAATYGYLATSAARNGRSPETIWANYLAAREAARKASGKVDTYYPLDISLWMPLDILDSGTDLGVEKAAELQADIMSTIDIVGHSDLDGAQLELFQRQRLRAGQSFDLSDISEDAFRALEEVGSTVGYYFRAKRLAPALDADRDEVSEEELTQARQAAEYLLRHRDRTSDDPRCLRLLLSCLWLSRSRSRLFRGLRRPIPHSTADLSLISEVLADLAYSLGGEVQPKYRYLSALMAWCLGDENQAVQKFRELARDTEYVEGGRVLPRHILTDPSGAPILFSGTVERKIGDRRWSIHVRDLNRNVDLVEGRAWKDISLGKEIRGFSIAFNYLGPIADSPR